LVVVDETGRAVIFDWKTVRKRPSRERLFTAMQTRIYPLVLALSGKRFQQSQEIAPGEIEMQYIFLEESGALERFPYSVDLMKQDQLTIEGLIQEILAVPEDGFHKTADENRCRACLYRSYCERGTSPVDFRETDDPQFSNQLELDFENLPEEEL
jgi:CRISPR/Cas system-associated exonuclease Cas4 (RecB family)